MKPYADIVKEKNLNARPKILTDRARIATEVYRDYPSLPIETKRARIFERTMEELPVFIGEGELIVGGEAEEPGDAQFFPEFAVEWLAEDIDQFELREDNSRFYVSREVKEELRELMRFWEGKTVSSWVKARMPEKTRRAIEEGLFASVSGLYYDIGHVLPGYEKVLKYGLSGILNELRQRLDDVDLTSPDGIQRKLFYESAMIVCKAAIQFAHRYSEKALELIKSEKDPKRREVLERIAEICLHVPEYPARTFREAVQAFWFTHLMVLLESKGMGISPGRFDQYMYPYFRGDVEKGMMSEEDAEELLKQLWLKFNGVNYVLDSGTGRLIAGYPSRANLVLGGQTEEGRDAVNELSFLCLKVTRGIGLPQPSLSLRYHNGISEKFLREACRLIGTGIGLPAIYNDEIDIPALLSRGISYRDALNFALVGCVELAVPGKSWTAPAGSKFNLVRCLELTLNGGKSAESGEQIGPECGDFTKFRSFDELFQAFKLQVSSAVSHLVTFENLVDMAQAELVPCPFLSCLVEDCIVKGKDVKRGGAIYNFTGPQGVGLANVADSLAAIQKLVFEDRKITAQQLKDALRVNFEGMEEIRGILLHGAPKYGNADDDVDRLARDVMDTFAKEVASYRNPRGGQFQAGMFPATAHVSFGKRTGATPDGRLRGEPFADAISPAQGRDRKGITAVIRSVAKLNHIETSNGTLLNQKLHPLTVKDEKGIQNLAALVRAFCDMKNMEIQFNVVDAATLRAAQDHPEQYRSLVVRVAGWSALFTGLNREVQDDIIRRTEQMSLI